MTSAARIEPGMARPFRVEAWTDGDAAWVLLLARAPADVVVLALRHDAARRTWMQGSGIFPASALHAPRQAVADALPLRAAGRSMALRFGLHGTLNDLARFVHGVVCADLAGRPAQPTLPTLSASLSATRTDKAGDMGYESVLPPLDSEIPARCLLPDGLPPVEAALHVLPSDGFVMRRAAPAPADAWPFGDVMLPVRDFLRSRLDPGAAAVLAPRHWSPDAEAFYAADGATGSRRRQAAGLYPVLAPMIARLPEVGRHIDAGRPFEAELARALGTCMSGGAAPAPAFLRRLRAVPGDLSFWALVEVVDMAAALPLDWLPKDAVGWDRFLNVHRGIARFADTTGLSVVDLVRDANRWWRSPADGDGFRPEDWLDGLEEARDMARRASLTLVEPLLARPAGADVLRLSGRALFGGLASGGVIARARAWHDDLPRFDRILPDSSGKGGWPELFPPFDAGGGIEVAVLTSPDALRDEGSRHRDASGSHGLDHCVAGYARDCRIGTCHIASVRRIARNGRHVRLSTVELAPGPDGMAVRQHRGPRNQAPPPEAAAALERLLAAVASGSVTLSPEALAPRVLDAAGEPDRRAPGAIAAAMLAWRGHLPRSAPRDDPGALADWLSRGGK
jgi:hypothetical protein